MRSTLTTFTLSLVFLLAPIATAQTDTTFTYQGSLVDSGALANGSFNLDFALFDALSGGNQIGSPVMFNGHLVVEGLFTVELDFGASAFDNSSRWLEISVNGSELSPRQPITRSPYSIQTRGIFVDENNNVGIGTTTPLADLYIDGTGSTDAALILHEPGASTGELIFGSPAGSPGIVALAKAAQDRGATFLVGEDMVSIGLGVRGRRWPDDAPPDPGAVDWESLGDIPVALVTGTNGKSTTVRLTASIVAAAGRVAGQCTSDWVRVGAEIVDTGDYSGPSGARQAARHPRTEVAILETARGGLMRRGLALPHADVCLITNVAADPLGEYGIIDLPTLADAKFLVAGALRPGGRLVLNAYDPELVRRGARHDGDIAWFSLAPGAHGLDPWIAAGGPAAVLRDGWLVLARDGATIPLCCELSSAAARRCSTHGASSIVIQRSWMF